MTTNFGVPAMEWIFEEDLDKTEAYRKAEYQEWLESWIEYTQEDEGSGDDI